MFKFLNLVSAVYFYHKHSKQFMGISEKSPSNDQLFVPVSNVNQALNLRINEGGVAPTSAINPISLKDITEKPSSFFLRIQHPTSYLVLDWVTSKLNEDQVVFTAGNNAQNQKFSLAFLSDFSFLLQVDGRCAIYDEVKNHFKLGSCNNSKNSRFEIFLDTRRTKTVRFNANDSPFSSIEEFRRNPQESNVTRLLFKDGKAIKIGGRVEGETFKFNHKVVDISKVPKQVRHIKGFEESSENHLYSKDRRSRTKHLIKE